MVQLNRGHRSTTQFKINAISLSHYIAILILIYICSPFIVNTMKNDFLLFLNNNGDFRYGFYRAVALLPASHQKGRKLWIPYEFIMDMSRVLILCERRNFQNDYIRAVSKKFNLVINRDELSLLPLVDIWRPYYGQQVNKTYRWDQCFPVEMPIEKMRQQLRKKKLPSLTENTLYEWHYDYTVLIQFFSDPRFQNFLHHSGFQSATDQMHLNLSESA